MVTARATELSANWRRFVCVAGRLSRTVFQLIRKMPVERDRLMMLVIVGSRIWEHCFKRDVGIGSKSQLAVGDWEKSLETSSLVTQVKDETFGGVNGGGKWGEVEIRLISQIVWSLWILSEKLAKDWHKRLRESQESRSGKEERWRSTLIVFQSWRGLVELDEMREEVRLAFMMAAW